MLTLVLAATLMSTIGAGENKKVYVDGSFLQGQFEGVEVSDLGLVLSIPISRWVQATRADFEQWAESENLVVLERGGVRLAAVGDEWVALENSPFSSPYALGATGAGDNVYIVRGYWRNPRVRFARYCPSVGWMELNNNVPFPDELRQYFRNSVAMVWDGGDHIYLMGGSGYFPDQSAYRDFYRYSISNDSWERMADTPSFQGPGNAMTLVEDEFGNRFIYAVIGCYPEGYRGNLSEPRLRGRTEFWRFNLQTLEWDKKLEMHPYGADDGSSLAWTGGDYIYHIPGAYKEGLDPREELVLMRYSISTNSWRQMASAPGSEAGGVDDGGSMVWDGGDHIYVLKGGDGSGSVMATDFWRYSTSGDFWEILDLPEGVGEVGGQRLAFAGKIYFWRGFGSTGFWRYNPPEFFSSGNFTSGVFDAGSDSVWKQITWDARLPHGIGKGGETRESFSTSIRVWTRSSSDNFVWSEWVECTNGSPLPWENRYLQYRVELSTSSNVVTPVLRDVCITYVQKIPRVGTFTSRVLELGSVDGVCELSWEATLPDNTSITFATRTSKDGLSWSDWDEVKAGVITSPTKGRPYLQVRATLQGVGEATPELRSFSIRYARNRVLRWVVLGAVAACAAVAMNWMISKVIPKSSKEKDEK